MWAELPSTFAYSTIFVEIYRFALFFSFCLSLLCVCLTLYILLNDTPKEVRELGHRQIQMALYRVILVDIVVCGFCFDLLFCLLWTPVPLFPVLLGFSTGPSRLLGPVMSHIQVIIAVSIVANLEAALVLAFLFLLAQISDGSVDKYLHSRTGCSLPLNEELQASQLLRVCTSPCL